jgi:hypothetical protein
MADQPDHAVGLIARVLELVPTLVWGSERRGWLKRMLET